MKRLIAAALLAALVVVAPRAEVLEQILVKVNGDILTKTDLEQRQISHLRQRNQQINRQDLENDESLRKILNEITPQILLDAVNEMLIVQRGRELGYRLSDEQFKSVVENIRKENKIETEEAFQAALKQENMTMDDLRRSLERQMLMARVQQIEVMGKISVTEAEERAYYQAHSNEFATQSNVMLREILLTVAAGEGNDPQKGINVGLDDEVKKKAEQVRARLANGEDFAKVAAEVSDAPSKANGGLIGPIKRTELSESIQQAIAGLKVGDITPPMRIAQGYQILKVESAADATVPSFDSVREQIADKVFAAKRQEEMRKYLDRLRASAIIEWKNDEVKKLYEQRLKQGPAPAPVS